MLKKNEIAKSLGMILLAGSALVLTGCSDSDSDGSTPTVTPPSSGAPVPSPINSIDPNNLDLTVAQFIYALSAKQDVVDELDDVLWESVFEEDEEIEFPKIGSLSGECFGGTFSRNVTTTGTNPQTFKLTADLQQCKGEENAWAFTGSFTSEGAITNRPGVEYLFEFNEVFDFDVIGSNTYHVSSFKSELKVVERELANDTEEESESGYYLLTGHSNVQYQFSEYESKSGSEVDYTEEFDFSVSGEGVEDYSLSVTGRNERVYTLTAGDDQLLIERQSGSYSVTFNGSPCGTVSVNQAVGMVVSSSSFSLSCTP